MAGYESNYNDPKYRNTPPGQNDAGGSYGLFQVGPAQINDYMGFFPEIAKSYGLDPSQKYTKENLMESADFNTRAMLFLGEATMKDKDGGGFVVGPSRGLGTTIGINTWKKLANGNPTGNGSDSKNRMVQRTTNQGVNAYANLNVGRSGAPVGFFSIPAVGSKVWVMFEGGSPQRPIYMGQVYDPSNIQAVG
jgi:hypothetical protein